MKTRKEILLHPIRMQILQYLSREGKATPGKLADILPEVPRTTLYRHVNLLYKEGYLKIVREVKIRGTYEREYEINEEFMGGSTPQERERQDTSSLLFRMLGDFEEYYERPDCDSSRDMLFFTENTLKLTDEEFSGFLEELFALLAKYDVLPERTGQKPRSITMISAPVTEKKKKAEKAEKDEKKEKSAGEAPKAERSGGAREGREKENAEEAGQFYEKNIEGSPNSLRTSRAAEFSGSSESFGHPESSGNPETSGLPQSPARKLTDRRPGIKAFDMPVWATYDMVDKVKGPSGF